MGKWVSVKERLPDIDDPLYALCAVIEPLAGGTYRRAVNIIAYDVVEEQWACKGMIVTHWMPLPDPPKEDDT